jgi:uncharacterized protein (DUF2252 family)
VSRDPIAAIIAYNRPFRGRYSVLLRQKILRLARGPFDFFRGTYHLFTDDLAAGRFDPWKTDNPFTTVEIPIVGDIHSENYGTYRAEDGRIQYDINDFDETTVGTFGSDCKRAATSLFLAAYAADRTLPEATSICAAFVTGYVEALTSFARRGNAARFGYDDAHPPRSDAVRRLLETVLQVPRSHFIEHVTRLRKGRRTFQRGPRLFDLKPAHRRQAQRLFEDYRDRFSKEIGEKPGFLEALDFAGRVAGCGSLGRLRYVALLEGEDSRKAHNVILEIKESLPSALDAACGRKVDRRGRAETVTRAVRLMQTRSNRFLGYAVDEEASFQVREIGPRDARLSWAQIAKVKDLDQLGEVYARLLAKAHAKADQATAGKGARVRRIADSLQGREQVFIKRVTAFALGYSEQVEEDQRRLLARRKEVERALLG